MNLKNLLRTLVLLTATSVSASGASQPATAVDMGYRGEFVRGGAGFGCRVEGIKPEDRSRISEEWCLHMGGLAIGEEASTATFLGAPAQIIPGERGVENRVFFLERPDSKPYLVVTVVENRIAALQITGDEALPAWSFNRISLGATAKDLTGFLGEPMTKTPREGYEHWSYYPWSFSFEVTEGRVTSIRIAKPNP